MFFALIFAYLGYTVAIYEGAVIGFMVGYVVDACLKANRQKRRNKRAMKNAYENQAHQTFYGCFFALLAKLTKADGVVTREEILAVDEIIKDRLKIKKKRDRKEAIRCFELGKKSGQSFHFYALHLFEMYADNPVFLRNTVHLLFQLSLSDGPLNSNEEKMIRTCAEIFALHPEEYKEILAQYYVSKGSSSRAQSNSSHSSKQQKAYRESDSESPLENIECFKVLGCEKSDPMDKIKSAYRKLVNEYHPDKIIGKDLPSEFVSFANTKFQEIQSAYEEVKKIKGVA